MIAIPHENQPGSGLYCLKKSIHQIEIHHTHLVHNYDIRIQRIILISLKEAMKTFLFLLSFLSHVFEKAVQRFCRIICRLSHPLSRPSRRRCQRYIFSSFRKEPQNCFDGCRFTGSGSSRNDQNTGMCRKVYRFFL